MIYHYCNPASFVSIVKSKTMWVCDLKKMNDPSELTPGFEIVRSLWDEMVPSQKGKFTSNDLEHDRFFYLAASFSKNCDLLSQWRSYGGNGAGFAIGVSELDLLNSNSFSKNILVSSGNDSEASIVRFPPPFKMQDVFYNEESFRFYISEKLTKFINEYGVPFEKSSGEPTKLSHINFYSELISDACLLKSKFYKEEEEVRIFASLWHSPSIYQSDLIFESKLKIDFMATQNGIKAYSAIKLAGNDVESIQKIVIGPKSESSIEEVELFMKLNSFRKCFVEKSEGEYR
ncbi:DUF2971 domain-containing protein [Cellvibrio fibrivorans]|uniref:DUF2971 domain-containing protein n=1 Tax=Cellvibrio fibrivorans TaxID=126350 RepID=A0ABU1UXY9_9GAMM|nr:DUF2971 domain-containing protein [Cellvibrio fibrivorans]MDR7090060.1 hypothetical protein [Cellvibrio fibrivorans]